MGFTSQDDLLTQLSGGKYLRRESAKVITPAQVAGSWHCLSALAGTPNATIWQASHDLCWNNCSEVGGDGQANVLSGIQHGGLPGGNATKHILNVGACIAAAAGAPWQAKLIDICGYYYLSGANITGTSTRTLINANTITFDSSSGLRGTYANDFGQYCRVRFTNAGGGLPTGLTAGTDYWTIRVSATTCRFATSLANAIAGTAIAFTDGGTGTHTMMTYNRYNGVGCEAFFVCKGAPTSGGPNLTASAYDNTTDTAGAGTRAFQGAVNLKATPIATEIMHSGTAAAGRYGPFLPKQGGDLGIARVNSFNWTTGTAYTGSGTGALVICKPLCDLALPVTGMWSERDLVNQLPSLPQIADGACLAWLVFSTGATTNNSPFWSTIDFGWGG